ncbi:hypothetical protein EON65_54830, partial [archaeon]
MKLTFSKFCECDMRVLVERKNSKHQIKARTAYENMEGYVVKRGHIIPNWRKRWLVVGNGEIAYYSDHTKSDLKKKIELGPKVVVEKMPSVQSHQYMFLISFPSQWDLIVSAVDEDAREKWIESIRTEVRLLFDSKQCSISKAGGPTFSETTSKSPSVSEPSTVFRVPNASVSANSSSSCSSSSSKVPPITLNRAQKASNARSGNTKTSSAESGRQAPASPSSDRDSSASLGGGLGSGTTISKSILHKSWKLQNSLEKRLLDGSIPGNQCLR